MTPTPAEITRLQAYLRENARGQYESTSLPPFTLFFHPTDSFKYFSYAIPDTPTGGDLSRVLVQLRAVFRTRGRTARFEFFEAFAPDLPAALRADGFEEEARQWSMTCTPAALSRPPEVSGLSIAAVTAESPDKDIYDFVLTQSQGFDPTHTATPTSEEIARSRQSLSGGGWRAFLGRIAGEPAGVSLFGRPIDGVTEVAGIATREAYRRRGIAALLTWHAVQAAFESGVELACLTAEDERAGRVYQRVGFQPFSTMLAYIDPERETNQP